MKPRLTLAQAAWRGGSCGSPPELRWKPGLTKWPNPSSSCGHSGLPGISSGLGWVEVGQAWLPKPRQLAGGGGYVSMVTMGVERSWGRVDPALWAPTLWPSGACCFSACIEVSLTAPPTGGPALPVLGVQVCGLLLLTERCPCVTCLEVRVGKGLMQSGPKCCCRRQWGTLRSESASPS